MPKTLKMIYLYTDPKVCMNKITYILDTSVYLHDANSIFHFGKNDIVVPLKVLEEIDKHKKRQDSVGSNSRKIIRILDSLREGGDLCQGVQIEDGKGTLKTISINQVDNLPPDLDPTVPDHIIVGTVLKMCEELGKDNVVLVTRDINLRVIGDSLNITTEDYNPDKVVENSSELYSGFKHLVVDQEEIDRFYSEKEYFLDPAAVEELFPNQFIMLSSNLNEKSSALARFEGNDKPIKPLRSFKNNPGGGVWGVKSKNKEQNYAFDLLMNPDVPVVTLVGKAGCGKTLLAIAAGLEQVIGGEPIYDRMIVSRPVQPMGRDIGYIPGTIEEKMQPWLAPIQDNLEFLMANDKDTLNMYVETGKIEVEALTYIRGRSIARSYIIIDEAQNLSSHELKTIITRVGDGTKIILTGDVEQIDNAFVNETSNGLAYAVEKFKPFDISGHVTLVKGERSKVATLASEIL